MTDPGSNRINVSEERLQLHLANFKLDLFKELTSTYATREQIKEMAVEFKEWRENLEPRVKSLEESRTGEVAVSNSKRRLANAAWALAVAVVSALLYIIGSGGVH